MFKIEYKAPKRIRVLRGTARGKWLDLMLSLKKTFPRMDRATYQAIHIREELPLKGSGVPLLVENNPEKG